MLPVASRLARFAKELLRAVVRAHPPMSLVVVLSFARGVRPPAARRRRRGRRGPRVEVVDARRGGER